MPSTNSPACGGLELLAGASFSMSDVVLVISDVSVCILVGAESADCVGGASVVGAVGADVGDCAIASAPQEQVAHKMARKLNGVYMRVSMVKDTHSKSVFILTFAKNSRYSFFICQPKHRLRVPA